jgi:hypothetical protein
MLCASPSTIADCRHPAPEIIAGLFFCGAENLDTPRSPSGAPITDQLAFFGQRGEVSPSWSTAVISTLDGWGRSCGLSIERRVLAAGFLEPALSLAADLVLADLHLPEHIHATPSVWRTRRAAGLGADIVVALRRASSTASSKTFFVAGARSMPLTPVLLRTGQLL